MVTGACLPTSNKICHSFNVLLCDLTLIATFTYNRDFSPFYRNCFWFFASAFTFPCTTESIHIEHFHCAILYFYFYGFKSFLFIIRNLILRKHSKQKIKKLSRSLTRIYDNFFIKNRPKFKYSISYHFFKQLRLVYRLQNVDMSFSNNLGI